MQTIIKKESVMFNGRGFDTETTAAGATVVTRVKYNGEKSVDRNIINDVINGIAVASIIVGTISTVYTLGVAVFDAVTQ
jgi:hypothetical protein